MKPPATESLIDDVQSVLKRYRDASVLEQHPAQTWAAVMEHIDRGVGIVPAIRQTIDQAITQLEQTHAEWAVLLRTHYLHGQSIEAMATERAFDPSSLHRQRSKIVKELTVIIAEQNHQAERRRRSERFLLHQPIVGFDALIERLIADLHNPNAPTVLLLEGMGGLGKTTLARCLAYRCMVGDVFAGVLWVSAKQTEFDVWSGRPRLIQPHVLDPNDLLRELARELQIDGQSDHKTLRNEVRAHCQLRPYLIVFDNLETVADMEALAPLVDLLAGQSRIVITTRDRALEALPATLARTYVPLSELDAPTSYQLLRSAAQHTQATALAQANDDDLAQIYAVTGGNPLALWLVAGQACDIPWSSFIRDLVERCPRGTSGYDLYDYLYRRSWEQLSDPARLVLFAMHRCESGALYDQLFELSALDYPTFQAAVLELRRRMLLLIGGQYICSIHRLTYSFLRVVIAGWWA